MSQFAFTNKNNTYDLGTIQDYTRAQIQVPTRGLGDNTHNAASTQWVQAVLGNGSLRPTVYQVEGLQIKVTPGSVQTETRSARTEGTTQPISVVANSLEYVWLRWSDNSIVVSTTEPSTVDGIIIADVETDAINIIKINHYITKLPWAPSESPMLTNLPKAEDPYIFSYNKVIPNTYWSQRHNYHFLFGYDAPYIMFDGPTSIYWGPGIIEVGNQVYNIEAGNIDWNATDPCINPNGNENRIPIYLLDNNGDAYIFAHFNQQVSLPDISLATLGYLHLKDNKLLGFETPNLVPFLSQSPVNIGKYAETIGDGVNTRFIINHPLRTKDLGGVTAKDLITSQLVLPVVEVIDEDNVAITFSVDMDLNKEYRIVLIG
jgi:hypothetical protein